MRRHTRLWPRHWAVLGVLLAVVLAGVLPGQQATLEIRIAGLSAGLVAGVRVLNVQLEVKGGSQAQGLRGILFQAAGVAPLGKVVFYLDLSYPIVGDPARIYGILDHLTPELRDRGYAGDVGVVDASGLVRILSSSDTPTVVMATTVIPSEVLSPTTNLLTPWLDRGGILVWTGGLIGGYVGSQGQTNVQWGDFGNFGWEGEKAIFGTSIVGAAVLPPGDASTPTPVSEWLGLRYPLAYVGAKVSSLQNVSGFAMGYLRPGTPAASSLSWVPVGKGGVVLFGDGPLLPQGYSAEDVIASDIAQIILSGIPDWDQSSSPSVVAVQVAAGATESLNFRLTLTSSARLAKLYVFSMGPLPAMSWSRAFDAVNGTLLPS